MRTPRRATMWAVWRDGDIYLIRPTQRLARTEASILRAGSKHEWQVSSVNVVVMKSPRNIVLMPGWKRTREQSS